VILEEAKKSDDKKVRTQGCKFQQKYIQIRLLLKINPNIAKRKRKITEKRNSFFLCILRGVCDTISYIDSVYQYKASDTSHNEDHNSGKPVEYNVRMNIDTVFLCKFKPKNQSGLNSCKN